MKKTLSFLTGISIAAASMLSLSANVSAEQYKPLFYFTAHENDSVEIVDNSTVKISSDTLKNGDVTVKIDIRVQDETQKCANVSAKIRSESEYVTIQNPVDPNASTGTVKQYEYKTADGTGIFTTDLTPFCYGSVDSSGNYQPRFLNIGLDQHGQNYFSCYTNQLGSLPVLGAATDEFPFGQFEAVISKDTPVGEYDLVFATRDNTEPDSDGQFAPVTTYCYIDYGFSDLTSDGDVKIPLTQDLKIIVSDKKGDNNGNNNGGNNNGGNNNGGNNDNYKLGDVNFDGTVNALDASLVLTAYANTATGKDSGFNDIQKIVGDVNKDNEINALDASNILGYYAYTATGGDKSFEDFLA